jgi:hypothetical protein
MDRARTATTWPASIGVPSGPALHPAGAELPSALQGGFGGALIVSKGVAETAIPPLQMWPEAEDLLVVAESDAGVVHDYPAGGAVIVVSTAA